MTDQSRHSVLQRMTAKTTHTAQEVPLTSSRAVRVAITRAADLAHGMAISVEGLQETVVGHDGLSDAIDSDWLMLALRRDGALVGLIAADQELRSAVIELQTTGRIAQAAGEERPATNTDAMLMTPLLATILKLLGETTQRTDLDGWVTGVKVDTRVPSARSAGLSMADCDYRVIRLTVNLSEGDRQGAMALLLPAGAETKIEVINPAQTIPWNPGFQKAVSAAPACLTAELHKLSLPLSTVDNLQVGQLLPLPGCTIASVKLKDANGRTAAEARLGQFAGMRAVRLMRGYSIEMTDMTTGGGQQIVRPDVPHPAALPPKTLAG